MIRKQTLLTDPSVQKAAIGMACHAKRLARDLMFFSQDFSEHPEVLGVGKLNEFREYFSQTGHVPSEENALRFFIASEKCRRVESVVKVIPGDMRHDRRSIDHLHISFFMKGKREELFGLGFGFDTMGKICDYSSHFNGLLLAKRSQSNTPR